MMDPRMQSEPELMLPCNIPEDIFDPLFIEAYSLLNSVDHPSFENVKVDLLTNMVSDILRIHDLYELYKENIAGLVIIYASWIILESLKREAIIDFKSCAFDNIFDNDMLMNTIQTHHLVFAKQIKTPSSKR